MVKKKRDKKSENGFDRLARLIKSESEDIRAHMATKEETNAGFAAIRKEMATKDDIAAIRREMATKDDIAGIIDELRDIKARLKAVEAAVEDHGGHSKEIDHAFERIAAIERHLGIKSKAH